MLSTTSEYAIRALIHLASAPMNQAMLGRDLSKRADVPPTYLSKIMLVLRNAGYVNATRGTGGGYELGRHADKITLMEIVELFEGPCARPRCVLGLGECSDQSPCSAHKYWKEVGRQYIDFLKTTTLADISLNVKSKRAAKSR